MHAGTLKAIVTTVVQAGLVLALMVSAASEVWTQRAAAAPPLGVPRRRRSATVHGCSTPPSSTRSRCRSSPSGLVNPWSLAWLPDGSMLITERPGRLRLLKNGVLDPTPISGVPVVKAQRLSGLMDVVLHPRFAENRLVYLTYNKGARRRHDGHRARARTARRHGAHRREGAVRRRAVVGRRRRVGVAHRVRPRRHALHDHGLGRRRQLRARGRRRTSTRARSCACATTARCPPTIRSSKDPSFKPEIYRWGHRNSLALIVHPVTGELWNSENGPNGGDEVNVVKAGKNYGWPVVSMGRSYEGPWQGQFEKDGMEGAAGVLDAGRSPRRAWRSTPATRFPAWKNNLFIGAMRVGEIPNTGHLQRVVFNEKTEEIRRESLLTELRQRIRDVRQGPDGLLYLLTDENPGALLKIEPAPYVAELQTCRSD